ncbi:MAG: GNAT family N-acetyltransferase [Myxococcales bacterium]|nr:GNAT family N-acetyltransferase [Myxococcales bacterium]
MSDPDDIVIRRASADDAPGIAAVHVASIRGLASVSYTPAQIDAWTQGKTPDRYRQALAGGEVMFAAARGREIVGFSAWQGDEVRAVYVAPAWARRGVGRQLLAAVERDALARGVRALRLSASLNAAPFYAARGYVERRRCSHALRSGDVLECVEMHKRLAG